MKKFSFRLQRVLDLREQQEEQAKSEVQAAAQKLAQANALWQKLQEERVRQKLEGDGRYFQLMGTYLAGLLEQLDRAEALISNSEVELAKAKKSYLDAYREAEKLRKLRAKQLEEYRSQAQKEEERFLDEVATLAYGRQSEN